MDEKKVSLILGNVKMSMEMEGFEIDEELEKIGRQIVTGEMDVEECVAAYLADYAQRAAV